MLVIHSKSLINLLEFTIHKPSPSRKFFVRISPIPVLQQMQVSTLAHLTATIYSLFSRIYDSYQKKS
jgi:hypothetical protein